MTTLHLITSLLILFSAFSSANSSADSSAEFSPHPACLDVYQRHTVINGLVQASLPLTDCQAASDLSIPYDYLGFLTYDRPRDAAGTPAGSVGYQRIAGAVDEVLYALRVNEGGNSVATELLVGQERATDAGTTLFNARIHGLNSECDGLMDAWTEPSERIHIMLNLSATTVLQALVAPDAQPSSAARDNVTLQTLFSTEQLTAVELAGHSCLGYAGYELDPERLQWRLHSLRLDITDDAAEAALSALGALVPALVTEGVAMLLGDNLTAARTALLDAKVLVEQPCDNVLIRAAEQSEPQLALELLGGCLAAPAATSTHMQVVLAMAQISIAAANLTDANRYLALLKDMLEANLESGQ
ncbi:hypothetical protein [Arsukibacterium sp.]|uniref:hypothetical protein n=1 Tax=Arsukibacterium sp. TaxID=1977258 RepID=UPI002FDB4890